MDWVSFALGALIPVLALIALWCVYVDVRAASRKWERECYRLGELIKNRAVISRTPYRHR